MQILRKVQTYPPPPPPKKKRKKQKNFHNISFPENEMQHTKDTRLPGMLTIKLVTVVFASVGCTSKVYIGYYTRFTVD